MNTFKLALSICAASALLSPLSAAAQSFDGRSLIGTGIGAGIGGAIGSNLAGGGVQDEGTAIGALVGGAIGYGIANSTRPRNNFAPQGGGYGPYHGSNYGPGYGSGYHGGYGGGASRYGDNYPGSAYRYGNNYAYEYYNSYGYQSAAPAYLPPTQYIYGGHVVSQVYTVPHYTTYTYTPPIRRQVQTCGSTCSSSYYVAPELMSTYCYGVSGQRSGSHHKKSSSYTCK